MAELLHDPDGRVGYGPGVPRGGPVDAAAAGHDNQMAEGWAMPGLPGFRKVSILCWALLVQASAFSAGAQTFDWDSLQPGTWAEIPNSKLISVAPDPPVHPDSPNKIVNVIRAWSGGAYDTRRDYFIVWGGGHADYAGNEIYAFDVNTLAWRRINDPAYNIGGDPDSGVYPDGTPRSVHSYNYILYVPPIDRFCTLGGAALYPSGNTASDKVFCADLDNPTGPLRGWEFMGRMPEKGKVGARSAYDPVTGHVWFHGTQTRDYLMEWDPVQNVWSVRTPEMGVSGTKGSMALDPVHRVIVDIGEGVTAGYYEIDRSGTLQRQPLNASGPKTVESAAAPGFVWDPSTGQFVGWAGGTSVYVFDFPSRSWKQCSPAASNPVSPTAPAGNGTFGRFQYVPSKNAFILVNDVNENVFAYRLPQTCGGAGSPDTSPPSSPSQLSGTGQSESTIQLQWSPAADPESGISHYFIYRDGLRVGQSGSPAYSDTGLQEATAYTYAVTAVNGAGLESTPSNTATVSTLADTTPPVLLSAEALGQGTQVLVSFSEPVEESSATAVSNYAIDNGVTVQSATLSPGADQVVLDTSPHAEGIVYTLTVSNIRDRASNPNTIAAGSSVSYQFEDRLIISNLFVATGKAYEVREPLAAGSLAYMDRSYTYASVPADMIGSAHILTANGDKDTSAAGVFLGFDINREAVVYVAHDTRYTTKPDWLSAFSDTGETLTISGAGTFGIYSKLYAPGRVELGANEPAGQTQSNSMYVVIVQPTGSAGQPADPPSAPTGLRIKP